jgi:hypothetical protein
MRRFRFERERERDVAAMLSAKYRSEADLLARTSLDGAGVNDQYAGVIYPVPGGSWTAGLRAETWTIPAEPQAGTCRHRGDLASRDDAEQYVRDVLGSDGPWYLAAPSGASSERRLR